MFYFETTGGTDVTAVIEVNPAGPPIGLVEISSHDCLVRVHRESGSPHLHQMLDVEGHLIDRCTPAGSDDSAELVMSQLSLGGKNSLYRMMMPVFLDLLGDSGDTPNTMSAR